MTKIFYEEPMELEKLLEEAIATGRGVKKIHGQCPHCHRTIQFPMVVSSYDRDTVKKLIKIMNENISLGMAKNIIAKLTTEIAIGAAALRTKKTKRRKR